MKRPERGRGLFYTRDSGGKHEMTPAQYVAWAVTRANELGLSFNGSSEMIQAMIQLGESNRGDVFLDFGVCGNLLSRPGLDRMRAEADADPSVSHILIPRRDRLARPDDPLDAIAIENSLRRNGITLVFMGRLYPPLAKGERASIEELPGGVIDYDRAGKDRTDLAQKIIYAQLSLAKAGYSTGGRPPYGFRRWLVKDDGTRRLASDDDHQHRS
ncbi:MAG TPA: recombinase family protein [Pirellulales bacterium]|nr:recombinase family protein [Pirellulales bacterium]